MGRVAQGETLARSQVIDPQLLCPGLVAGRSAVEKEHVRFHPVGIENARGQAQQRVYVTFLEQPVSDGFGSAAFEEHVVRYYHCRTTIRFEKRHDMLHEVQLFVARRSNKIVTLVDQTFLVTLAVAVHKHHAALLTEGRIGEHHIECLLGLLHKRIGDFDRAMLSPADAMQVQVHQAEPRSVIDNLPAVEHVLFHVAFLGTRELRMTLGYVLVYPQEEAARPAGGIADSHVRHGAHDFDDGTDERTWREILAELAALHIFSVLLEQPLINLALHVRVHDSPAFSIDQTDEAT